MMGSYQRTRIVVDTFQYRFLTVNLAHLVAMFLIFVVTLFVPLAIELDRLFPTWDRKERMLGELLSLHMLVWPPILAAFAILAIHWAFVSHRFAGPLVQFRRIYKAIADGNLCMTAQVRKHDYLTKEADSINEMIATLRMKIKCIEEQYGEARAGLAELRRAIDSGSTQDMKQNMDSVEAQMERLKGYVDQFRTTA